MRISMPVSAPRIVATASPTGVAPHSLDELGTAVLVRFTYAPLPSPSPKPAMMREATAFPTWDQATSDQAGKLGWDGFWEAHPAGATRLAKLDATTFDDAIKAARAIALTSRPGMADGDKQAQAVLQAADGAWYASGLGGLSGSHLAFLQRLGTYPGYWRPKVTSLVGDLAAIVGGASFVDLRGKLGIPVAT